MGIRELQLPYLKSILIDCSSCQRRDRVLEWDAPKGVLMPKMGVAYKVGAVEWRLKPNELLNRLWGGVFIDAHLQQRGSLC